MENKVSAGSGASKREVNPVLTGMLVMLLMVMAAGGYFGWRSVEVERENQRLRQEVEGLTVELVEQAQESSRDKAQLIATHQEEIRRLEERQKEWEKQVAAREEETRQKLQRSFDTLATVVNDSGSALDYLREMEAKVRQGQILGKDEVDELKVIAKGLAYLQAQYEKPLEEFRQLGESIEKELAETSGTAPAEERKFLRMMLDWKYRERVKAEEDALLKEEGRREALEDTQQELGTRYARAQQEMAAVKSQFSEHLRKIDGMADGSASGAEMASFFEVSSEVIKIHQRVMNIKAEPVAPPLAPIFVTPETPVVKP